MNNKKRLLIIGGGTAGRTVINRIKENPISKYEIVGIIDDNPKKQGNYIRGIKVIGGREDIIRVCSEKQVDIIMLTIPSIYANDKVDILNMCSETDCDIKVMPSLSEIKDKKNLHKSLRSLRIEDLLARDPILLDNEKISGYLKDKVVMVTGGGGSIGSELCRQIARFHPRKIVIFDIYENNAFDLHNELNTFFPNLDSEIVIGSVRDNERLNKVFAQLRPDIVFHAAAHKHVPLMENNPSEAVKNNVFGTINVASCAKKYNASKFILISTDKAVNPTSVMGATKRLCEMVIQLMNDEGETDFVAVRFGNVLGSNGSVVNIFKSQIRNGGPVTLTHKDITRYFMTISEAAQLVLEAASYAHGGEIYVLEMGHQVRIYDLAINMIKLSGLEPFKDIEIKITGLRAGEKLHEELLMDEEEVFDTANNKIHVAKPIDINRTEFEKDLIDLRNVVKSQDNLAIRMALADVVKTYTFESFDDFSYMLGMDVVNFKDIKKRVAAEAY
ncbi:MAG: polysaccharide biosynthesis protein [Clostridiaceae bacterium]|jgi:FlaA1/EpsC-like NDP-sugar epimerase|nr:polysaccharide biosynthesis protein [Clostridiaceae bacterium]